MPRKTAVSGRGCGDPDDASMRPRPDAAENPARPRRRTAAVEAASMRPRPDAAENRDCAGCRVHFPIRLQ